MRPRLRVSSAAVALALCWAAPAFAQDAEAPATDFSVPTAPSNSSDSVGDTRLRDFSLPGTVTRQGEAPATRPEPAREQPSAAVAQPAPAAGPATGSTTTGPARERTASASPRGPERTAPATAEASSPSSFDFAPPTPSREPTTAAFQVNPLAPVTGSESDPLAAATSDSGDGWASRWPWLLALLAAVGAAGWYFRRQRSGYALAGAGGNSSAFDLRPSPAPPVRPKAAPAPAAQPRAPAPAAPQPRTPAPSHSPTPTPPAAPAGVVSTRLRPWLDLAFAPDRVEMGEDRATLHFAIEIFNSGSAPARDVLVEAVLFNAGGDQDEAIARFFAKPAGEGERVPVIPPLQRMSFQSAVSVPREQIRVFDAGGRKVWVPLIGFNAFYSWGGGQGHTSASYLLGRDTAGDKMSPFRVDIGPRAFRGVGAREHSLHVRK